jgi:hypothetical protein
MSASGADEAKRLNQGLRDADHFRVRRRAEAVDRRHLVSIAVVLSGTDTFTELYGGSHGRAVITMGACARAGGQKRPFRRCGEKWLFGLRGRFAITQ